MAINLIQEANSMSVQRLIQPNHARKCELVIALHWFHHSDGQISWCLHRSIIMVLSMPELRYIHIAYIHPRHSPTFHVLWLNGGLLQAHSACLRADIGKHSPNEKSSQSVWMSRIMEDPILTWAPPLALQLPHWVCALHAPVPGKQLR